MNLACYICDGPGPKMEFIVDRLSPTNACWGLCKLCSIAVCTGHGRRNETPDEYQCALCVGTGIRKPGPGGDDPQQPTDPGPTSDEFINAYSDLRIEIREEVKKKLLEYFRDNPGPDRMNREAREVAAAAYEAASGVAEFRIRVRNATRELAGQH